MKWLLLATHYIIATTAYVEFADHEMYPDTLGLAESNNWITVAQFDLTKGDDCPGWWGKVVHSNGLILCQSITTVAGCVPAYFNVTGKQYTKLGGMIRGYQKGTPDGFRTSHDDGFGINEAYVDGVSITIGHPHRKHVWTYAAGYSAEGNGPKGNCPCSPTRGPDPPSFVGEDYYCQSGSQLLPDHDTYYMLPLWVGEGCTNDRDNCCSNPGLPWFVREFPTSQSEDIEVRICTNQLFSDEAIFIDKLHLSVYSTPE